MALKVESIMDGGAMLKNRWVEPPDLDRHIDRRRKTVAAIGKRAHAEMLSRPFLPGDPLPWQCRLRGSRANEVAGAYPRFTLHSRIPLPLCPLSVLVDKLGSLPSDGRRRPAIDLGEHGVETTQAAKSCL
jgi:hypothetical protein